MSCFIFFLVLLLISDGESKKVTGSGKKVVSYIYFYLNLKKNNLILTKNCINFRKVQNNVGHISYQALIGRAYH